MVRVIVSGVHWEVPYRTEGYNQQEPLTWESSLQLYVKQAFVLLLGENRG